MRYGVRRQRDTTLYDLTRMREDSPESQENPRKRAHNADHGWER